MFKKEVWKEIFQSIRAHKMRTFLTGFGVAWGIFMLVLLLCTGKGFRNGVNKQFAGTATNSLKIWGGTTTIPYKGLSAGRWIRINSEDLQNIKTTLPGIQYVSPEEQFSSAGSISYQNESGTYNITCVYPEYIKIEYLHIVKGRWLDPIDMEQKRKVVVITKKVVEQLFHDKNPIGEYLNIKGDYYMVVGLMAKDTNKLIQFGEESSIFIPYSTYEASFNPDDKIEQFTVVMQDETDANLSEERIKKYLSSKYSFDPKDNQALYIINYSDNAKGMAKLFSGINIFLWIIGISTLLGGVVGVGNIMLVTVKERTKEIGIRKALGAVPVSIISLVIQESILITTLSGIIGLLFATGLLSLIGYLTKSVSYFQHPEVSMGTAVSAILILVVAGGLAGFIPARKASKISPIEALRYE